MPRSTLVQGSGLPFIHLSYQTERLAESDNPMIRRQVELLRRRIALRRQQIGFRIDRTLAEKRD